MSKGDKKNKKDQQKPQQQQKQKAFEKKNKQESKGFTKNKEESQPLKKAENDKLNEQILALGGTKGDLKYLENIDIDTNDELITNESIKDETPLTKELESFMKSIGLSADKYESEIETDEEEMEEEEEEEEPEEEEEEEEEEGEEEPMKIHSVKSNNKKVLVEPTPFWYNVELAPVSVENVERLSPTVLAEKYGYARNLLAEENTKAEKHPLLTSSNHSFMSNIITSGTLNDKVSALTLMFRESPLHEVKTLDTLMSMGRKKGRNECVMAVTSMKDLFIGSVLPDRKLIYFADRPLASKDVTDLHLLLWVFEDHLKKTFLEYIKLIEELSRDTLMHVRNNMVTCINDLLSHKPEQEQNLLKLLVNKLGDSDNKVASKTSQMLIELLVQHPGMKMVVTRELEQLLLRPNITERAQYYAIITMNQTILTGKDSAVANKLIEIYFIFFRKLLKIVEEDEKEELKKRKQKHDEEEPEKKSEKRKAKEKKQEKAEMEIEDHQSKMLAGILTGVNRAFHFADISDEVVEKHLEVLFKITHVGTFNAAVQALNLIFTISLSKQTVSDRFYRTLYESLLDPRVSHSSKQSLYLNLLFKALRADSDIRRVKAYIKRMVQIASRNQPAFVSGIFFLLNQLLEAQPGLRTMLITPEEDDDEEHFFDAAEDDDEEANKVKQEANKKINTYYDGRKRDPRFSNAEKSCLWELVPFKTHYHPSIVKYTDALFTGEPITNQPDLQQFTLMHFLDKFVYRNAKKNISTKGKSIMQPLGARSDGGIMFTRGNSVKPGSTLLNSDSFINKKLENVSADEVFFHKYFNQKAQISGEDKTKKAKKTSGDDSDEDEDEVWRAMMASVPGGLDEDDDADLLDDEDSEDDEAMRALLMDDDDEDEEENAGEESDLEQASEAGSDADDFEGMDDIELMNASDMEDFEEEGQNKRSTSDDEDEEVSKPQKKKQKREKLPTFATYEDYAKLIEQDSDEE